MMYFLLCPLNLLCMILCFITNPIVALFIEEEGQLSGVLKLWQTWDDSCDPRFFVMEKAPKFLRYDYDSHYEEYEIINKDGVSIYGVNLLKPFTFKEKVQRYFCRVLWLYRNPSYGFSYYIFGADIDGTNTKTWHGIVYEDKGNLWNRKWMIKIDSKYYKVYLGWKFQMGKKTHCMIANRLVPVLHW